MKKYTILFLMVSVGAIAQIGVGAKKPKNADMMFDGSRTMLDEKCLFLVNFFFR